MAKTETPCVRLHAVAYNAVSNKPGMTHTPRVASKDAGGNKARGAGSAFVLGMSEYRLLLWHDIKIKYTVP